MHASKASEDERVRSWRGAGLLAARYDLSLLAGAKLSWGEAGAVSFSTTLPALGFDVAAIAVLVYAIYHRRHRRRDLLGAYVALNLGVFCAVTLLATQEVGIGLGFGLFAILSIVRLRSTSITHEEVGYYFVALTLGLVNGLGFGSLAVSAFLDAVLLAGMFVADHPRVAASVERRSVLLDAVYAERAALHGDLERRLGGKVLRCVVTDVDYVAGTTRCDVRFRVATAETGADAAGALDGSPPTALAIVRRGDATPA